MQALPEPTPVSEPKPAGPIGSWPRRAVRALFVDHRLPTSLATALDRLAVRIGLPYKTLAVNDPEVGLRPARIRIRRQSADLFFVREVFTDRAYAPSGYEIGESDTVIDVGANVGSFTIFAARRARRGRVIAIEPASGSFALLAGNVRRNRLSNVSLERAAMSDSAGPRTLHLSAVGSGYHSLDGEMAIRSSSSESVPGRTLAELFDVYGIARCHYLKLDCEGAEFPILHTLPCDVARRIDRIALEYHTRSGVPKRQQSDALARRLQELGFGIDIYTDVLETNRGLLFASR